MTLYGHNKTWHQTGEVNVELGPDGKVCSVWFRCRLLPFTETVTDEQRAESMRHTYETTPPPALVAVEFADKGEPK
jgi:hypothetical protein